MPTVDKLLVPKNVRASWFLLGILLATKVSVGGEIYVGEILAVMCLPFLLISGKATRSDIHLLVGCMAWSAAQLVSDIANRTAIEASVKGVCAPLVFGASLVVLRAMLSRGAAQFVSVLLGAIAAAFLQVVLLPNEAQIGEPWKWGYGPAVLSVLLFSLSFRSSSMKLAAICLVAFMLACVYASARSLALLPVLGLMLCVVWRSPAFSGFAKWLRQGAAPLKVLFLAMLAVVALNASLGAVFSSKLVEEFVPQEIAEKYRRQATSDVGLLLAGRSESLVSIKAILDKPLLGHGSWAEDDAGYLAEYAWLRFKYGIADDVILDSRPLIPAHSYLLGAFVWAGVVGGLFWIIFTYRLVSTYVVQAPFLPLYFHAGVVSFVWSLLFSPFGADSRWSVALFVSSLLSFIALRVRQ